MDIRPYETDDRQACLSVFDSNVPRCFSPDQRVALEQFLEDPNCPYFVMEHDGATVGCGGYTISADGRSARLLWGMIRSDAQNMGLGRFLLLYRLREIGKTGTVSMVEVEASPVPARFFEEQGLRVTDVQRDGYGPGLDRITLSKKLTVCA